MMATPPTIALVLAGCGVSDGSEATETIGAIIALSQAGYRVRYFAPDRLQRDVIDHASGRSMQDARNMLIEAARLTRGSIEPLSALTAAGIDGLLLPGGSGVLRNLSNFVPRGPDASLAPDVSAALTPLFAAGVPMVGLCVAPLILALLARGAGVQGVRLTFGHEDEASEYVQALEGWGMRHVECVVDEACIDERHHFASVPAWLYGRASPAEVFGACQAAVSALGWLLAQKGSA